MTSKKSMGKLFKTHDTRMKNKFGKIKALCAIIVGFGLTTFSATPMVTSVTAQQRYPWNGLVDIVVTMSGAQSDVENAICTFAATNSATKTALKIAHVAKYGDDVGFGMTWTRRFIWDTNADLGEVKIDEIKLFADVNTLGGVQLWEGGPYWAECNVGATEPEEYGYYFWWGDTVGYTRVSNRWDAVDGSRTGFSFNDENCPTYEKSNLELKSLGYIDSTGNLVAEHDAATAHLGAPWRMPTEAEIDALISNCTTTWTMRNGISGRLVTGKGAYASKSIFLPAAGFGYDTNLYDLGSFGYYWSSTPFSDYSSNAWCLYFYSGGFSLYHSDCNYGQSVRAVRGDIARFNVVYLSNGGDGTMADSTFEVGADATLPTCSFTREGYYFMGWATSANGDVVYIDEASAKNLGNKDETITLYAVWLAIPEDSTEGVQLWEGGPYWAECNVGATEPEEYGYYFWWGDTVGYTRVSNRWDAIDGSRTGFSFNDENCPTYNKSNLKLESLGYIDSTGNLVSEHDAATAHLGAPWRMPTEAEFLALTNNCTTTWTMRNGISGRLVTGKGAYASKSIFLPAAGYGYGTRLSLLGSYGYYLSSSPYSDNSYFAWYIFFNSGYFYRNYSGRGYGRSVRPVRDCHCFNVVYEANGGDGTMADSTFEVGAEVSLPTCSFTREGYVFMGWATSANGDVVYIDEASAKNLGNKDETITLYAVWSAIPEDRTEGVQLWEGGPYWAECNVGATEPEEYGYYFWWGDTIGYTRVSNRWDAVDGSRTGFSFYDENCPTYDKSNLELESLGYIDSTGNLVAEHDAATAHLGAPWRMPTEAEIDALISNCTTTWTMRNGISGRLVTGKGAYASKSIFLPAAGFGNDTYLYGPGSRGYYWSSSPSSGSSYYAWDLFFSSGNFGRNDYRRYHVQSVRPVRGFAK